MQTRPPVQFSGIYLHKPSLDWVFGEEVSLEYGQTIAKHWEWERQALKDTHMDAFVTGDKKFSNYNADGTVHTVGGSVEVTYFNRKTGKMERVETFASGTKGYPLMARIVKMMYRLAGIGAYGRKERIRNLQEVPHQTVARYREMFPFSFPASR